jgi:hypothetical protein
MAGPREPLAGIEHAHVGRRAAVGDDEIGVRATKSSAALRHHEAGQLRGLRHCRREPDAGEARGKAEEPREAEREQVAALRGDQRVQLVEDHAFQRAEQIRRVGRSEQERRAARRGEAGSAAGSRRWRCVSSSAYRRCASRCGSAAASRDRRFQVARNVDGERLSGEM